MRIPRQLLYSTLAGSLAIASVALSARAQTQTPNSPQEPPRIKAPIGVIQAAAVTSCEEQIKTRFGDNAGGSLANFNLGWCYLDSRKFDDAVAAFQKAFQLIPEWIKKLDTADFPELSQERKEELQRNAKPSLTRFAIGWTYQQANRYDEAVAAYRNLPPTYPVGEEARYQTAMVYLMQGNREAAAQQVAKLGEQFERRLEIESKLFIPDLIPASEPVFNGQPIIPMTAKDRPTILYREKAKYTEEARQGWMQGTVAIQAIFRSDGAMEISRITRYLPYGLTLKAVEAASKIKFSPAVKNGEQISVKGALEFTFNLY